MLKCLLSKNDVYIVVLVDFRFALHRTVQLFPPPIVGKLAFYSFFNLLSLQHSPREDLRLALFLIAELLFNHLFIINVVATTRTI